jgi:predicted RNA-binding protein with RPS1 domain
LKVYWRSADGMRTEITLGELIGSGKEGDVYRLAEQPTVCAKVYRERRADVRHHIGVLMGMDSTDWYLREERHLEVAWPFEICEGEDGTAVGFFMSTLPERYFPVRDAFSTARRARTPSLNWGCHVALAADLARMVGKLHAKGMLVGDLALPNLAASSTGRVLFLDSDSFVITLGGKTYGGGTWRPDNSPPDGGPGKHTVETDYFALAVAVCELLLEEFSPFAGVDTSVSSDEERSPAANIARGRSWLFHSDIRTTRGCPPRELLSGHLRDLAYAAFEDGAANPRARPDAQDWYHALVKLGQNLRHCGRSPQHVFNADEWNWCPWCERTDLRDGQDPFPSQQFAPAVPPWLQAIPIRGSSARWAVEDRRAAVAGAAHGAAEDSHDELNSNEALQPADLASAWTAVQQIYDEDGWVSGTVTDAKDGLTVKLDLGLRGLIPASLLKEHSANALQAYVGLRVTAKLVHVDEARNRVILSFGSPSEEEPGPDDGQGSDHASGRRVQFRELSPGQVRRGRVKKLKPFGAFVDLGGVDGLVHVSELSWDRVSDPSDVVKTGQEITVKVLSVDEARQRVSLSLKATQEDPFLVFARTHELGQVVTGRVKRLQPYGAFIDLGGIDGMVHVSELSWESASHPAEVVTVGEDVLVRILAIETDRRRIRLSLRLVLPQAGGQAQRRA